MTRPEKRVAVLPPSADPFYKAPAGYEATEPGTILAHRKVPHPIAALGPIPLRLAGAYQILYRSNDNFGNPTVAVTTVLIPQNADTTKLLSYQIPEDAPSPDCAPSYVLQTGPEKGDILSRLGIQIHTVLFIAALEKGWVVSIPDFEGLQGAFLANRRAGYAVLDGIRAVLNSTKFTKVSPNAKTSIWGYSGGSLATGFAAELQPLYAPELEIAGAALGGLIGSIENVIYTLNKGPFVGLVFSGFHGMSHEYQDIASIIREQLTDDPVKRNKFLQAADNCFLANVLQFTFEDIFSYFKDPNILQYPAVQQAFADNNLGQYAPEIPLFVYKGSLDEISPVRDTESIVSGYCAAGTSVKYNEVVTHAHVILQMDGFAEAFAWLEKRMNGVPAEKRCKQTEELLPLSEPGTLDALGTTVVAEIENLLGI
ncbi:uncharacterized protein ATNIH1004_004287 [Aspergillus tanneri]|uniref:Secretory lipase-domain-containing protein n=1 Tax=Aspergillus tanneri TaxID=1220188 RepID=A0A5M9MMZ9_9EURO|nr:uncharacterized protein ATNIH1004_004287 [Aspergillus tanneri]KAA8648402.1 hypothetical protein ATNIH1004_004287 [Aspergillus tanneri]